MHACSYRLCTAFVRVNVGLRATLCI